MNIMLKITIITPSFNQAKFIERTIRSVVNQNYPNLEYIIKDAGSTDGSIEIIKKYVKKYPETIKFISKKDKGQADGINQGINLATGQILAFLNSDDIYLPGTLKKVANFLIKNPKLYWVTGECKIIDENDKEIRSWIKRYKEFWLRRYNYNSLLVLNYISQPATFWRSKLTKEIGILDITKNYTMDYDFWLRIGGKYNPGLVLEDLACFRIHTTSKSGAQFLKQFNEDLETVKKYTKNDLVLTLHNFSNNCIKFTYKLLNVLKEK